jgi:hypothetical protein
MCNMQDYTRVDNDGNLVADLAALSRDQAAALHKISYKVGPAGEDGSGRAITEVKFDLADKRAALVDLGRHFALFTDKLETHQNVVSDTPEMSLDEWAKYHGVERLDVRRPN